MKLNIDRRKFLALAGGSALTLPFLRSLPSYAQTADKKFLILVFTPNGVVRHNWGADKIGSERGNIAFRTSFKALDPYKEYVTIINGLRNTSADEAGGTHEGGMETLWTGGKRSESLCYPSIDQLIGPKLGGVRSTLEFRVMSNEEELQRNRNNRMIFDSMGVPIDPREDATKAAEQLFAGVNPSDPNVMRSDTLRAEVFGQLANELKAVKPKLCSEDQVQLESLRAGWDTLQQQLSMAKSLTCSKPSFAATSGNYFRDRSRQMIDVMVMSLACDLTRTASLQFSQGRSDLVATFLGLNEKHHDLSHQQPQHGAFIQYDGATMGPLDHYEKPTSNELTQYGPVWDKLTKLNTFYAEEFAYLLKRLKETTVAGGKTLLDQSLVVWGSEVDNGAGHDHFNMPFVVAGGAAGKLNRGTVVNYPIAIDWDPGRNPAGQRYHADLLLTIPKLLGINDITAVGLPKFQQGLLNELIVA
ncbi:MAG: DUF1552 domain-containing protein [Myxococcota bacterium]